MVERAVRLRGAPVIHDTIDNETIAINQRTGRYYSLDGASAFVWQTLEQGSTPSAIVAALADRYDADHGALEASVAAFLDALRAEELVVEAEDVPSNGRHGDPPNGGCAAFPGLALHHYTDMEVLLLADPIHEVDETGWPTPLPSPEA